MRRFALSFALVMILFSALTFSVSANSPAPPGYFYYQVINAGETVKFADILIKINPGSNTYTDFNASNNISGMFNAETPIVAYQEDGYRSLSFHYSEVYSNLDPESGLAQLANSGQSIDKITTSIKIALLDEDGNILKVSNAVDVVPAAADTFPRGVKYDADGDTPVVQFHQTYIGSSSKPNIFSFAFLFAVFLRMILSVSAEILLAIPFKLKPVWKIAAVNLVSQLFLISFMLFGGLHYLPSLIIGEIIVFASEFVVYTLLFRSVSKRRIAGYAILANAITLILGLYFNAVQFLVG